MMEERKKKGSGLMILGLMAGYTFIYMDKNMISFAINAISDIFGYTSGQMGLVMGVFFLSYSFLQPVGGQLVDRIGAKKMMIISMAAASVFSFLFGMVSSILFLCLIRVGTGASHASYPPGVTRSIADNIHAEKKSFAQSMVMATSGIGGILAFVIGARLIEVNWRLAYVFIGILYAVAAIVIAFVVPEKLTPKEIDVQKKSSVKIWDILRHKKVLLFCVTQFLYNFAGYGVLSWIPKYLQDALGMSVATSGVVLAVVAVVCTIGCMITGLLLSKVLVGKEKIFTAVCAFASAIALLIFIQVKSIFLAAVLLVIINILLVSILAALVSWPHRIIAPDQIGSSVGVINGIGTLGGFFAPTILGFVLDATNNSFSLVFIILAIAAVLCGVGVLMLSEKRLHFGKSK